MYDFRSPILPFLSSILCLFLFIVRRYSSQSFHSSFLFSFYFINLSSLFLKVVVYHLIYVASRHTLPYSIVRYGFVNRQESTQCTAPIDALSWSPSDLLQVPIIDRFFLGVHL